MFPMLSRSVVHPLINIFLMQSIITMAIYSLPVIMPVAAGDIGVSPESVGFYMSALYIASTITGLFSGQLVARIGAPLLFRVMLLLAAVAVIVLLYSTPLALVAMAALVGVASGPMNPTGSQVLAQVTPVEQRAFVFSLKQCATPAGGALAGIVLPPLMLAYGWHWALAAIAVVALLLAVVIVLPRGPTTQSAVNLPGSADSEHVNHAADDGAVDQSDADPKHKSRAFSLKTTRNSIMKVWSQKELRSLTAAAVGLAAAQMGLATYLVVYLWREIGFSEAAAGLVFAGLHIAGISARIVLGLLADRVTSARRILTLLCVVLAVSLLLSSLFTQHWPLVFVYAVIFVAGGSGNGWVGLYYAELARLTPVDQVAEITGASQFFTYIGLLSGPVLFAALLAATDSFRVTLILFAVMIAMVAFSLVRSSVGNGHEE